VCQAKAPTRLDKAHPSRRSDKRLQGRCPSGWQIYYAAGLIIRWLSSKRDPPEPELALAQCSDLLDRGAIDVMLAYYAYADHQIAVSIKQRDAVTLFYLGAIGAILGTAFGASEIRSPLLIALPVLGVGATAIATFHNVRVGVLSTFREEIDVGLRTRTRSSYPRHLDSEAALDIIEGRMTKSGLRYGTVLAQAFILVVPPVAGSVFFMFVIHGARGFTDISTGASHWPPALQLAAIALMWVCVVLILILIGASLRIRLGLYETRLRRGSAWHLRR
jgi:hypothetical protein